MIPTVIAENGRFRVSYLGSGKVAVESYNGKDVFDVVQWEIFCLETSEVADLVTWLATSLQNVSARNSQSTESSI